MFLPFFRIVSLRLMCRCGKNHTGLPSTLRISRCRWCARLVCASSLGLDLEPRSRAGSVAISIASCQLCTAVEKKSKDSCSSVFGQAFPFDPLLFLFHLISLPLFDLLCCSSTYSIHKTDTKYVPRTILIGSTTQSIQKYAQYCDYLTYVHLRRTYHSIRYVVRP